MHIQLETSVLRKVIKRLHFGNLLSGVVGTWWSTLSPEAFFLAMAGIAAISGILLSLLAAAEWRFFNGLMSARSARSRA